LPTQKFVYFSFCTSWSEKKAVTYMYKPCPVYADLSPRTIFWLVAHSNLEQQLSSVFQFEK